MTRGSSILDQLRAIPPLRVMSQSIDAECFNTVRIAMLRHGAPLAVELKRPLLTMLVDESVWVAVPPWDHTLPLLMWRSFDHAQRGGLHEPVHCELRLFDMRSGLVMRTALDALCEELRVLLSSIKTSGGDHAAS